VRQLINVTIIVFILCAIHFGLKFYKNNYYKNLEEFPKMYCYEHIRKTDDPVSVIIIEDLDLKEPYLEYYSELKSGIEPILDDEIPLMGLPQFEPVYVIDYNEDSLLAKVICYYNHKSRGEKNVYKGWVYSKTLHKEAPCAGVSF